MAQITPIVYAAFTALDLIGRTRSAKLGAEMRSVWHETGPTSTDSGVLVIGATRSLAGTPLPEVILVPGGPSTPAHARDEEPLQWLRQAGRRLDDVGVRRLVMPILKGFGAIPVADERIVCQDYIATSAGVSAQIELALWPAGQIGGEGRAKAIQLAIEYDPQPSPASGHLSVRQAGNCCSRCRAELLRFQPSSALAIRLGPRCRRRTPIRGDSKQSPPAQGL